MYLSVSRSFDVWWLRKWECLKYCDSATRTIQNCFPGVYFQERFSFVRIMGVCKNDMPTFKTLRQRQYRCLSLYPNKQNQVKICQLGRIFELNVKKDRNICSCFFFLIDWEFGFSVFGLNGTHLYVSVKTHLRMTILILNLWCP